MPGNRRDSCRRGIMQRGCSQDAPRAVGFWCAAATASVYLAAAELATARTVGLHVPRRDQ
jgi:hypothetical protein